MRGILRRAMCATLLSLWATVATGACGDQPALTRGASQPFPTTLSPETRQQLAPILDVRAAEQFFRTMPPGDADRVLAGMGFYSGRPPAETESVVVPMRSTDPGVQEVLDRMWAPYWRSLPASAAADPSQPYPGRELARITPAAPGHGRVGP